MSDHNPFAEPRATEDRNDDLIGFEYEFADKSKWKVVGTDEVLGTNYVRLLQTFPVHAEPYQRIQTAADVRRRKQLELERAGQGRLFEGPS